MSQSPSPQQIRRDVLKLLKTNGDKSFRPKEISKRLGLRDNAAYGRFRDVLDQLDEERLVKRVKGGRYTHKPRPSRAEGVLSVVPKGFGFVAVEGMEEDLYVHERNMKNALDGDRVLVGMAAPSRGDKRREAEVIRVVERKRVQAVGTLVRDGHFAYVVPDDKRLTQDVYVPLEDLQGAEHGEKVVVSIDRFEDRRASPEGRILRRLGSAEDPEVRVLALAMSLNVKPDFPKRVLAEAEKIPEAIPKSEIQRRRDLRGERVFTIDPFDAKDFDDAIHIKKLDDGAFEVGVHIADVSHYVQEGTDLDAEAYGRGTSVYLVDRTVPMLPEKLSNKVCSLRPEEDKLTYSCIMEVTARGRVRKSDIVETVIHSKRRYTYDEAQDRIDGGYPDDPYASDIVAAARLARTLTKKRMREGSVDFDLPEVKVLLDERGEPTDIIRKERKEANRLIEEFMLLANRTVAERIAKGRKKRPFVYRVHEPPDVQQLFQLAEYVKAFGYRLDVDLQGVDSRQLNKLVQQVQGKPEAAVIEMAALRAMSKAVYAVDNVGHYGLGFRHYTHFTSPIRRYPDLIAHRLLKRYLSGGKPADAKKLEEACEHTSAQEREAVTAERESVKLKQVEYMQRHLGDTFDGVVSGTTRFGVFVEMTPVLVEGMVHVRDMDDDYYEYDERRYTLTGQRTGRSFRPGDDVRVKVLAANIETREIDLVFV